MKGWVRIGVIVIVLAVLAPAAVAAQGELTLQGLAEMVEALTTRVDAVEALFSDPWSPDVIQKDDGICQSPLHQSDSFILRGKIRQETADSYRAEYGVSINPEDVYLRGISFGVENSNVYLWYEKSGRFVVETWAHCEFLSHSEWGDE